MMDDFDASHGKTAGDLGREALWFTFHTLFALLVLAVIVIAYWIAHTDPDAMQPKIYATVLALVIPLIVGGIIARVRQDRVAKYTWISAMLLFSIVCVWVLDLPTGNGLCEHCDALDKLTRTFFSFNNGSGLMGGDGVLVGFWMPLAMIGYAIGAKLGLED
jgi:hypothetical protein